MEALRGSWLRAVRPGSLLIACALSPAVACSPTAAPRVTPAEELEAALRPGAVAAALRALGGAHASGVTRFAASLGERASGADVVTTTTELWTDPGGGYRIEETNDRGGGREVVLTGRELFVALRYGKMIRRLAEEPEPTRLLEEAVGGPWAAWDLVRRFAVIEPLPPAASRGRPVRRFRISLAPKPGPAREGEPALRRWRDTVKVEALAGEVHLDEATSTPVHASLRASYGASRGDQPIRGEVDVRFAVEGVGAQSAIEAPRATSLEPGQRTVPEERELLGGLGRAPRTGKAP